MLTDRALQIEVLINSPGPHDQVRVREPFLALKARGVDVRLHERPFRFNSCIRPHSLVIWQRPLPESRQRQWEHLQWLRKRGCLLLTEWDDHPNLFPEPIQHSLNRIGLAPLALCHALHTSTPKLAEALRDVQPIGLVMENRVARIPVINLLKHNNSRLRLLVANQNRNDEHAAIGRALGRWSRDCKELQVVVIADRQLASAISSEQLEFHSILDYKSYRKILASCQIALLPLTDNPANACKTPIKLLECAAESVAAICGPGLYQHWAPKNIAHFASTLDEIVPAAQSLAACTRQRQIQVSLAHQWVNEQGSLDTDLSFRIWLYQKLWAKRVALDLQLLARINQDSSLTNIRPQEFGSEAY